VRRMQYRRRDVGGTSLTDNYQRPCELRVSEPTDLVILRRIAERTDDLQRTLNDRQLLEGGCRP
jgi:hypothetical protein